MKKRKVDSVKLTYVYLILVLVSLLPVISVAQEGKSEIYALTYSPSNPVVLEKLTITADVRNNEEKEQNYKLLILVTKEGKIKDSFEFLFYLDPKGIVSFSPVYTPDDIGDFEIIAKLYDKYEIILIDTKIIKFNTISNIGPFDLSIEVPTMVVRPGQTLPVILSLKNMGESGTDVEINLEIPCYSQPNMVQTFFIFLGSKSEEERLISLPTCKETGLHNILARVILFNRTCISSMSQFILNDSSVELMLSPPRIVEIRKGEPKFFDLSIKNSGNIEANNLRVLIEGIPLNWVKTVPSSVLKTKPNETVVFLINITVPPDIRSQEYSISFVVAADEILQREYSVLNITSLAILPPGEIEKPSIFKSILVIVPISVAIFLTPLYMYRERSLRLSYKYKRKESLRRVKSIIEKREPEY